jgi:hypothetical protein
VELPALTVAAALDVAAFRTKWKIKNGIGTVQVFCRYSVQNNEQYAVH